VHAERPEVIAVPNTAMRFKPPAEAVASSSATIASASASGSSGGRHGRPSRGDREREGATGTEEGGAPRTVYVLRNGKPEPVSIKSGLSDGTVSEVVSGELKEGDPVVVDATVAGKPSGSGGGQQQSPRMGRMF
jgi:HlyD family secretion protein